MATRDEMVSEINAQIGEVVDENRELTEQDLENIDERLGWPPGAAQELVDDIDSDSEEEEQESEPECQSEE